jgi:nucleotide-binding universal stress UspA family protein
VDLTPAPAPSVVVGFDGGPASVAAAHEGARQARRRLLPLHLVTAEPSVLAGARPGGSGGLAGALEVSARGVRHGLDRVREEIAATRSAPSVSAEHTPGRPEQVLVERAGPEGRVVVGAGGSGTGLGPVPAHLVRSAPCPVLVHRDGDVPDGPVVVGVDCRPGTTELLGAAVDEACVRGTSLVVLHAWGTPASPSSSACCRARRPTGSWRWPARPRCSSSAGTRCARTSRPGGPGAGCSATPAARPWSSRSGRGRRGPAGWSGPRQRPADPTVPGTGVSQSGGRPRGTPSGRPA